MARNRPTAAAIAAYGDGYFVRHRANAGGHLIGVVLLSWTVPRYDLDTSHCADGVAVCGRDKVSGEGRARSTL
jgi:hypothetical protein